MTSLWTLTNKSQKIVKHSITYAKEILQGLRSKVFKGRRQKSRGFGWYIPQSQLPLFLRGGGDFFA